MTATTRKLGDDRLLLALLIAGTLHMLLIFGVTFEALRAGPTRHQVEVTLLQRAGDRPLEARHVAAADQRGEGREALREIAAGQNSQLMPRAAAPAATGGAERGDAAVVTSPRGERRVLDRRGEQGAGRQLTPADNDLARISERLAQLEASLSSPSPRSQQPRVRRIEAVAAMAAADAAYLAEWRRRVETVGNQYYPQASLRYGIYGELRMLVTVASSGELEDVRVLESSGYAVLDEAALRIVRLAAPYPPFPPELASSTDKLEIVRTWQFEQNPLSSN